LVRCHKTFGFWYGPSINKFLVCIGLYSHDNHKNGLYQCRVDDVHAVHENYVFKIIAHQQRQSNHQRTDRQERVTISSPVYIELADFVSTKRRCHNMQITTVRH